MSIDWDALEGVEAAERLLRAALVSAAREVHLTSDEEGATVFFLADEQIEFFCHLPCCCRENLFKYMRAMTAIDSWKPAPVEGYGVFAHQGRSFQIEVRFTRGVCDEDAVIKISKGGGR